MNLHFHVAVQRDINEVLTYYSERSLTAADRFWEDLQSRLQQISDDPERFGFISEKRGLRRVKLRKFPYVIIYYVTAHETKVTCVKHEKRHPAVGMSRR